MSMWQTVMQKNRVKALYQDWTSLKQVTGFAAFSRNVSQSSAKVRKELASWSAWYCQVLEDNGGKHISTIYIHVFFTGCSKFSCRLRHHEQQVKCTSRLTDGWLSHPSKAPCRFARERGKAHRGVSRRNETSL